MRTLEESNRDIKKLIKIYENYEKHLEKASRGNSGDVDNLLSRKINIVQSVLGILREDKQAIRFKINEVNKFLKTNPPSSFFNREPTSEDILRQTRGSHWYSRSCRFFTKGVNIVQETAAITARYSPEIKPGSTSSKAKKSKDESFMFIK